MRRIIKLPAAKRDLITAADFIAESSMNASDRFLRATENAFKRLAEVPGLGVARDYDNPLYAGMQMWFVPNFRKYLIFYRATDDCIEIIRVLHGARDIQSIFAPEVEDAED